MPRLRSATLAIALAASITSLLAMSASAIVNPGEPAPAFTKNVLGGSPPTISLSDYAGKVVILAVIGYS